MERQAPERRQEPGLTFERYAVTNRLFIVLHLRRRTGVKVTRFFKKIIFGVQPIPAPTCHAERATGTDQNCGFRAEKEV
jgi:hypothetical protein